MKFTTTMLLLVGLLAAAPTPARAQDVSTDEATTRELYNLAEEQAMLARSIQRLRQTMDVLAARLEAEGRTRAVELLRQGLAVIDKRAEETAAMTLDERMEAAREELSRGQWESSLARQQEVISDLESLLEVLLDRQDLDKLEERLEELQATQQALDALQSQETELRKDTQSALDKAIEAALGTWQAQLDELSAEQESTLRDTEREARATDALERERIADGLKQLATSESQLGELLENWEPNQGAQSQASLDRLGEVAKASQASAEVAEVAAALEAAAEALENDAPRESVAESLAGLRSNTGQEFLDAAQAALAKDAPRPSQVSELRTLAREAAAQAKAELERAAALAEEAAQAQKSAASGQPTAEQDPAAADPGDLQAAQAQAKSAAAQASAAAQSAPAGERQQAAEAMQAAAEALNEAARRTQREGQIAQRNAEFLPRAVAGAQAENQRDASDLRDALERLSQTRENEGAADEAQALREAKDALEAAIEAMQASERAAEDLAAGQEQASSDELQANGTQASSTADQASTAEREALRAAAAEAAATARERLDEAQAAVQDAAQATRTSASEELEAMQRALAEKAAELKQTLEQRQANASGSQTQSGEQQSGQQQSGEQQSGEQQSGEQQPGQEAMERAQEAMERAAEALEQGQTAEAADAQREALESLDQAGREAREAVRDQSPTAEQLAGRQKAIEDQLLKLAERLKQEERDQAAKAVEDAQKTAKEASEALENGDLSTAEEKQREVESQLQEAEDELAAEEEKYQQLRAEEVLIQITQEIQAMQTTHKAQLVEVEEIETARGGAAASRSQKVRLRRIAREEELLAQKAVELTAALSGEGSIVFASAMDEIRDDLERAAAALGADSPQGGYDSGWRTQSLMQDADRLLAWLFQALTDEAKRRQDEEQKPETNQEEQSQPESEGGEPENRLVPSQAELRLLRSMEIDVQSSLQQTLEAYPELAAMDPADVDPLILEDIMRLAERHNRITKLFTQVAAALGVPGMEADSQ